MYSMNKIRNLCILQPNKHTEWHWYYTSHYSSSYTITHRQYNNNRTNSHSDCELDLVSHTLVKMI